MSDTLTSAPVSSLNSSTNFAKTSRVLEAVPDGHSDFKPHEKSMLLTRLGSPTDEFASRLDLLCPSS